jgi:Arc/MetJ family transcription regulator
MAALGVGYTHDAHKYRDRTNIEIDDELVGRVMSRYGLKTKRAAIARHAPLEVVELDEGPAGRSGDQHGRAQGLKAGAPAP